MRVVTFKTLTAAYRGREVLRSSGIMSELVSVDPAKTRRGCAFGLMIDERRAGDARRVLSKGGVEFGDIS